MEASNILAITALAVSMVSVWISYKAYRYTISLKESEALREFTRERSEFLVRIEKAQRLFESLDIELKSRIAHIESKPKSLRVSLTEEMNLLSSEVSNLEGSQRQARALWQETYDMNQSGLDHHKPRFLALIEEDETLASEVFQRLDLAERKRTTASDRT